MTNQFTRRFIIGGAAALLGGASFAEAPTKTMRPIGRGQPDLPPAPRITADQLIARSKLTGDVSFTLIDLETGQVVAQRDSSRLQPPASVTKAITAAYAMAQKPADFRFATRLMHTGEVKDGVIHGDLILLGGGDPTLGTDNIVDLVKDLKSQGIWKVTGRFIVSGGGFPRLDQIDPKQPPQVGYNPAISGLNLNFNRVRFDWKRVSGGAYDVSMRAAGSTFKPHTPVSRMVIAKRDLPVYQHRMQGNTEEWSVARSALGKEGGRWLPTRVPELYAGEAFVGIARTMGMQIPLPQRTVAPNNMTELARHSSVAIEDILRDMLRYSTNLTAEVMGFTASGEPDLTASSRMFTSWARQNGIAGAFADHSGLSDQSMVTTDGLAKFMVGQAKGGLPNVLRSKPLKRKNNGSELPGIMFRAKTGSLNFVSTLAGYLDTPNRKLAFAIVTADMTKRNAIKPGDRERPAGGGTWAKRSRSLQYDLLRLWALSR